MRGEELDRSGMENLHRAGDPIHRRIVQISVCFSEQYFKVINTELRFARDLKERESSRSHFEMWSQDGKFLATLCAASLTGAPLVNWPLTPVEKTPMKRELNRAISHLRTIPRPCLSIYSP
ncbi:MAG: hypothetical protein ACI9D0_000686, partial [Bacteroidia bacterium]